MRRIVLGVTAAQSLGLMAGQPAALSADGWDVHVVSSPGPAADRLAEEGGVTVHALPMERDPSPVRDLLGLVGWVRLLAALRPDVVSVGTPKAGFLGILAARLCRVPQRVYMLRGLRYESADGLARRILVQAERIACSAATHVLTVSDSLRAVAVADRLAPQHKLVVLAHGSSNGIDVDRFRVTEEKRRSARAARWEDPSIPVIGFVGRLVPDKGADLLLDAARILADRGTTARILLIGPTEGTFGRELLAAADASDLPVEAPGLVDDLQTYLPLMDALCLPTKREGFPNVVLEAAVAEVPTVAPRVTGTVDAIVDGETGILCGDRTAQSLAGALSTLLADPARARSMGRAARDRAVRDFERFRVQSEHLRFYDGLVAPAQPSPVPSRHLRAERA